MKHHSKSAQVAPAKARSAVTLDDGAIMTPGIRDTTSIYLTRRDSALRATIITRTSFNGLYSYIDSGISVVVWSTMYFGNRECAAAHQDGFTMHNGTYAVTSVGYDVSKTKELVSDPLGGSMWRDAGRFKYPYGQLGKQAVVIQ